VGGCVHGCVYTWYVHGCVCVYGVCICGYVCSGNLGEPEARSHPLSENELGVDSLYSTDTEPLFPICQLWLYEMYRRR
jgi:hypothetical protein